jgi:hypothetical protein
MGQNFSARAHDRFLKGARMLAYREGLMFLRN